jgi:hypothetical protein
VWLKLYPINRLTVRLLGHKLFKIVNLFVDGVLVFKVVGLDAICSHGLGLETSQHFITAFKPVLQGLCDFSNFGLT